MASAEPVNHYADLEDVTNLMTLSVQLDRARAVFANGPDTISGGRSVAAVDYARVPIAISPGAVASGKLRVSTDVANAASRLWEHAEFHFVADYVLMRAALEASVVAWWILSPVDSDERCRRAYRVTMDDLVRALKRENAAVSAAQSGVGRAARDAVRGRVQSLIESTQKDIYESGITIEKEYLSKPRTLDMREVLETAEREIDGMEDLGISLLWAILSTSAHGSITAMEQLATRDESSAAFWNNPRKIFELATKTYNIHFLALDLWNQYLAEPQANATGGREAD